jgi:hypothetical protein
MSAKDHVYVSFINWGDGGEIHLRKCDVVSRRGDKLVAEIVYDDDYDEKERSHIRFSDEMLDRGLLGEDLYRISRNLREADQTYEWGPTWNPLYARAGKTRRKALQNQKKMLEHQVQQLEDRIETAKRLIEQVDDELVECKLVKTYDTTWETVDNNPMVQIAIAALDE